VPFDLNFGLWQLASDTNDFNLHAPEIINMMTLLRCWPIGLRLTKKYCSSYRVYGNMGKDKRMLDLMASDFVRMMELPVTSLTLCASESCFFS
jgi:hypothetical protein